MSSTVWGKEDRGEATERQVEAPSDAGKSTIAHWEHQTNTRAAVTWHADTLCNQSRLPEEEHWACKKSRDTLHYFPLITGLSASFSTINHPVLNERLWEVVRRHRHCSWLLHTFPIQPSRSPLATHPPPQQTSHVKHTQNASFHCHARDARLCLLLKANDPTALDILRKWLHDVKRWVSQNLLHLSDIKSEVILCHFQQGSLSANIRSFVGAFSQWSDFSGWGYEWSTILILTFGSISSSQPTL